SMGGIAGSQVLTLVIRGQALGHLSGANFRWLFHRELLVAALNGGLWAIIIAIMAWVWFNDIKLSLIMSAAIIINLMAAA
ncbi:magnesium transporter, partial [Wenyingzhuangia sp. 1_MG-2023]|nr:magnesium transporter [Wenyingzhuangia sp. 1_MG-2023]